MTRRRIAVVGAGVGGLVAAHLLAPVHDVTLYEARSRPGGHAHTALVDDDGASRAVDTGFVVFNDRTYPLFRALLDELGVTARKTDMSFSVRCERSGLEYNGTSLNTLFAQRRNLFRPSFIRMIRDILRFYREAPELLARPVSADDPALGEYLSRGGYSDAFVEQHLVPMAAAVWSASPETTRRFPARFLIQFFRNHGFLEVDNRPQWFTVEGGSRSYVDALLDAAPCTLRVDAPVESVRRTGNGVLVASGKDETRYDQVVIATHAPQALRMLDEPREVEREVLGAVAYQHSRTQLHTDERLLPRKRLARAAWNYHRLAGEADGPRVTYDMTRLHRLPTGTSFLVSLNRADAVAPDSVRLDTEYAHPIYSPAAVAAQARWAETAAAGDTFFCGAYWGYGFHEDGVRSAHRVAARLGAPGARAAP